MGKKRQEEHKAEETYISLGEPVKALGEAEDGKMRVGAYGVRFGTPEETDLVGDWFGSDTDYGPHQGDGMAATFNHCTPVHPDLKSLAEVIFRNPVKATKDELGIFVEHVLDMADEYEAVVAKLVKLGKLRWSSGTAKHLILRDDETGQLKRWHIAEWAYAPQAAEPRLPMITPLKTYTEKLEEVISRLYPTDEERLDKSSAGSRREQSGSQPKSVSDGEIKMDELLAIIMELAPDLSEEQARAIAEALLEDGYTKMANEPEETPEDKPDMEFAEDEEPEEDPEKSTPREREQRSVDETLLTAAITAAIKAVQSEEGKDEKPAKKAATRLPYDFYPAKKEQEEKDKAMKSFNAFYEMRFGDENEAVKAIYSDLLGSGYRQQIHEQSVAFAKYLRSGMDELDKDERKALKRQIFPIDDIKAMINEGMNLAEMKTTMVEAQTSLGGAAVPPNVQTEITRRLPGLTAVRGAGARVVTLVNSNSVEIPRYTGGDDRYIGALRGAWGTETQAPSEDNATTDLVTVVANVYTYKVPMSMSLVEDAANLVQLVQQDIAATMAIDEDEAFLIGAGGGQPYGILPDSANSLSLTEAVSGNASLLTSDGLIELSESLADQYMEGAVFALRRSTASAIRKLKTGDGEYLFDRYLEGGRAIRTLLGYPYRRTEAMPAVASSAYPIIFGNMAGYTIVERAGLSIERFHDSNTGINKVEFHVRKRVGGRVERPWMFAVQKVSAS